MSDISDQMAKPVDDGWISQSKPEALRTQRRLISVVGLTALLLPPALVMTDTAFGPQCLRTSLSHYYYGRPSGDIFVMTLAFIGTLLLAYRGEARRINRLAGVAGIAAIITAILPTDGAGCPVGRYDGRVFADVVDGVAVIAAQPFELFASVGMLHYAAAAVLFGLMFYFCQFVFTLIGADDIDPETGAVRSVKRFRNMLYRLCAAVIALVIGVLLINSALGVPNAENLRLVLIAEWIAMAAFGLAWLVKGRVFNLALMGP